MMLSQTLGRLVPLDLLARGPAGAGTQVSVMSSSTPRWRRLLHVHRRSAANLDTAGNPGAQAWWSPRPRQVTAH